MESVRSVLVFSPTHGTQYLWVAFLLQHFISRFLTPFSHPGSPLMPLWGYSAIPICRNSFRALSLPGWLEPLRGISESLSTEMSCLGTPFCALFIKSQGSRSIAQRKQRRCIMDFQREKATSCPAFRRECRTRKLRSRSKSARALFKSICSVSTCILMSTQEPKRLCGCGRVSRTHHYDGYVVLEQQQSSHNIKGAFPSDRLLTGTYARRFSAMAFQFHRVLSHLPQLTDNFCVGFSPFLGVIGHP